MFLNRGNAEVKAVYDQYQRAFKATFGVALSQFWDPNQGFLLEKFQPWLTRSGLRGITMDERVQQDYGEEAVRLFNELFEASLNAR